MSFLSGGKPKHDVAISYRSENIDKAQELHDALTPLKLRVFFDKNINARIDNWGKDVRRSLAATYKSSLCCVVLMSDSYFQSKWTRLELSRSRRALPVVVGPLMERHRTRHDIDWPVEGAMALVPTISEKLEKIKLENEERTNTMHKMLGVAVTGIAAISLATKHTQDKIEESTGSIDGYWTDMFNRASWQIQQSGDQIFLRGKLPNGVDVAASGSRRGRDINAEWASQAGRGTIKAKVSSGGRLIQGQVLGMYGHFLFHLSR
jgi:hypothetical protein